jgi:hypothetical protein
MRVHDFDTAELKNACETLKVAKTAGNYYYTYRDVECLKLLLDFVDSFLPKEKRKTWIVQWHDSIRGPDDPHSAFFYSFSEAMKIVDEITEEGKTATVRQAL